MLLTVSTEMPGARDLGHLLRKHPDRVQSGRVTGGTAWVFYPEASDRRCTAALLVEIDPAELRKRSGSQTFPLAAYVSDVQWSAGSLMSVALKEMFGTALTGAGGSHAELAATDIPLELTVPVAPAAGGADLPRRMFEPLGWQVSAAVLPADEQFPEWGNAPYVGLRLRGRARLADALNQLYVLLPVLSDSKHYWVGESEIDKLLRAGGSWLGPHPERDFITRRYLAHRRDYTVDALARLGEVDQLTDSAVDPTTPGRGSTGAARRSRVVQLVAELGASTVLDLGCGEGALLAELRQLGSITRLVGTDVSARSLDKARRRLHLDNPAERPRMSVELLQSSVVYRDSRLRGFDAAVLMEVVEHVDPARLAALADAVFGDAAPRAVIVSTPNADYNVRYPGLAGGGFRHSDHRFEWTRAEFGDWAARTAAGFGYRVRFETAGAVDPELGAPTQLAEFVR